MSTSEDSLYCACFLGNKHRVRKLANPVSVYYVHPDRRDTPLHHACKQGWLDIVKLLIEKYGCDSNMRNEHCNQSPLDWAKRYYKNDVVSYLQEINSSLYWACFQGNKRLVLKLLNPDSVNYVHPVLGDTPLHRACKRGCLDIVKLLIEEYGCDPTVRTGSNKNVLHYACGHGHIDVVKYLIDKQHVNPLLRDYAILEPLDYALNNNKPEVAAFICQHCISSDEMLNPNRINTTINLIKYLLRVNPRSFVAINPIKWKTSNGDNILLLVGCSKSFISHIPSEVMLEILNSCNAKYVVFIPDSTTSNGDNILELACQSKMYLSQTPSALILKWIGDATINKVNKSIPDSKTADGDTLLQLVLQSEMSISKTSSTVLSKLLNESREIHINQIDPSWKTLDGIHFLHVLYQLKVEDIKIVELMQHYILKDHLNTFLDSKGNTALHIACQANKLAVVSYLIDQAHCDPNIKNKTGSLPIDITTNPKVIDYLCLHDHVAVYSKTIVGWMNRSQVN